MRDLAPCARCHRHIVVGSVCPFCARRAAGLAVIVAASLSAAACGSDKKADPEIPMDSAATTAPSAPATTAVAATTAPAEAPSASPTAAASASPTGAPSAAPTGQASPTPAPTPTSVERPKPKYGIPSPRPAMKYGIPRPPPYF